MIVFLWYPSKPIREQMKGYGIYTLKYKCLKYYNIVHNTYAMK